MKLKAKLFIEGKIEVMTGLAIGGSKTDVAIGGIDNNVIKDSRGVPYIPGSSLKGKIRSLMERKNLDKIKDKGNGICTCGKCDICAIFGTGASKDEPEVGPTRLYVRDAFLDKKSEEEMKNKKGPFAELDFDYTETKWENVIDRRTSKAVHPRQQERVPAGALFNFSLVFNVMETKDLERFEEVICGLKLLEDDYLGGNGSRGYGRIKFTDLEIKAKTVKDYEGSNRPKEIFKGDLSKLSVKQLELNKKLGD